MKEPTPAPAKRAASPLLGLIASVVFVTLLLAILLYFDVHYYMIDLLRWVDAQGIWGPVLLILLMALVVVLVLPGILLTTGAGFVFGVVEGSIYIVLGTTLGALAAFMIARYLFGPYAVDFVRRRNRLRLINEEMSCTMKWTKWLPWRFAISYIAKKQGILDPIPIMARVQALAQPSEVAEPIELIRSGVVFHARGLINSRVIQHNLDWVWPVWIERQFDPKDPSFIPRAFAITHINISNRNWTAVGYPDCPDLPIVDPNGLLTPLFNGWSLDAWLITKKGSGYCRPN